MKIKQKLDAVFDIITNMIRVGNTKNVGNNPMIYPEIWFTYYTMIMENKPLLKHYHENCDFKNTKAVDDDGYDITFP